MSDERGRGWRSKKETVSKNELKRKRAGEEKDEKGEREEGSHARERIVKEWSEEWNRKWVTMRKNEEKNKKVITRKNERKKYWT